MAFLFLSESQTLRFWAVVLAALSDWVDGYIARRYQSTTLFGTILDPLMDKFFVYFALFIFYSEGKILSWGLTAMLSRDVFLVLYGLMMLMRKRWKSIVFRSVRWGKVTTALQFAVLVGLVFHCSLPPILFCAFVAMGWLAFLELFQLIDRVPLRAKNLP